jgi:hypothetical protein
MGLNVIYTDLRTVAVGKIEEQLNKTDYKVIKAMENYLVELGKLPSEFKETRDKLRTEINEIREP